MVSSRLVAKWLLEFSEVVSYFTTLIGHIITMVIVVIMITDSIYTPTQFHDQFIIITIIILNFIAVIIIITTSIISTNINLRIHLATNTTITKIGLLSYQHRCIIIGYNHHLHHHTHEQYYQWVITIHYYQWCIKIWLITANYVTFVRQETAPKDERQRSWYTTAHSHSSSCFCCDCVLGSIDLLCIQVTNNGIELYSHVGEMVRLQNSYGTTDVLDDEIKT